MEHDVSELLLAVSNASAVWKQSCRSYTIDANQRAAFQAGIQDIEACRQRLKDRLINWFVATDQPRGFSTVSGPEVNDLLSLLRVIELDMVMLCSSDPPWPPQDCAASAPFSSSLHAQDVTGIDACLEHHKAQLMKLGIQFDSAGGFSMYNLHRGRTKGEKLYTIRPGKDKQHGGTEYHGNVDGCLAPSGLTARGASCASRVVYMHMQRSNQEQQRQDSRPPQGSSPSKQRGPEGVPFNGAERGQAVIAMLAACAYNSYPLIFDLTDGKVHHLLQIHGDSFHTWAGLTPQQAYWRQAQMLLSSPDLADPRLTLESIPPELQEPMRKLRRWRAEAAAGLGAAPK